jgi:hypothetical protein
MPPLLALLAPLLGNVLDRVLPGESKEISLQKLQIQNEVLKGLNEVNIEQLKVNAIEAADASLFKSGWRPAVAWICVVGFAYSILSPVVGHIFGDVLPAIDVDTMYTMLMALLGLGGYRSFEKLKGLTK